MTLFDGEKRKAAYSTYKYSPERHHVISILCVLTLLFGLPPQGPALAAAFFRLLDESTMVCFPITRSLSLWLFINLYLV